MIELMDHTPEVLDDGRSWDAVFALGLPDGERYAVAGVRRSHPLPELAVKFSGLNPFAVRRQFERTDLPEIKRRVRAMCPGAAAVISLARPEDTGFVKLTGALGWHGHGQHAFLNLED